MLNAANVIYNEIETFFFGVRKSRESLDYAV